MSSEAKAWAVVITAFLLFGVFAMTTSKPALETPVATTSTTTTTQDGWTGQVAPEDLERPPG